MRSVKSSNDKNLTTIVSACSSYPRYEGDSAAIFLRTLNKSFDKRKYRLVVLAPDHKLVEKNIRDLGIDIVYFRYFFRRHQSLTYGSGVLTNLKQHPTKLFLVPFYIAAMFIYLCKVLWTEKPKLIHAHWILPQGLLCVLAGKLFSVPVIITAHGGDAFALKGWFTGVLKRISLWGCTTWSANTDATAKAIDPKQRFKRKLHIIPMGIDVSSFTKPRELQRHKSRNEKIILLFVGRLVSKKGASVLLSAFSLLSNDIKKNCVLWIVGDGSERKRLEKQTQSLKLTEFVHFFGEVPNTKLKSCFHYADILIVPSIVDKSGDTEGQGVVILEGMASEIPVIASAIGGIKDVIEHNVTGYLFRSGDALDLANTISQTLSNRNLSPVTNNALNLAKDKYDVNIVANQFTSLYKLI